MKRLSLALSILLLSLSAGGEPVSDYDAVKTTIFNYFDGVRLADRARLETAFDVEHGHMKGYVAGADGVAVLTTRPIGEVIDDWSSREPKPQMKGRILAIDIFASNAATAVFDFDGVYLDTFQLVRHDGQWRIVNKLYVNQ